MALTEKDRPDSRSGRRARCECERRFGIFQIGAPPGWIRCERDATMRVTIQQKYIGQEITPVRTVLCCDACYEEFRQKAPNTQHAVRRFVKRHLKDRRHVKDRRQE